ncbi:MAG: hypothetical protein K2X01_02900 [Cyanobacteria bacterium]|nr:hypothetical protein [Cyanobacteriota bacterium]
MNLSFTGYTAPKPVQFGICPLCVATGVAVVGGVGAAIKVIRGGGKPSQGTEQNPAGDTFTKTNQTPTPGNDALPKPPNVQDNTPKS